MTSLRAKMDFLAESGANPNVAANKVRAQRILSQRLSLTLLPALASALLFSPFATIDAPAQEPVEAVAYHAPTDPRELLKVDEPMRRYFGARLEPGQAREDQLRSLLKAILLPDGLHFTYDRVGTFDPRETFRQRRGNCVSYSFLVVAIARDFGFNVSFQNVLTPLRWDRIGNLIISVRHMNLRVDLGREYYLIDLNPEVLAETGGADMRMISDARACAEFYGTAGFIELLQGRPEAAMQYMVLATMTDPRCADAWANLATLHSKNGQLGEARIYFERALSIDAKNLLALEGYVSILQRLGSNEDLRIAAKYEHRAQSVRDHNPFYQQSLAGRAQDRGDWVTAEKHLRRAIALKNDEPQFYEQWGTVLLQLGRTDDARRAAARLEKLRHRLNADQVQHTP